MKIVVTAVATAIVLPILAVTAGCNDLGAKSTSPPQASPPPTAVGRQELPGGVVAEVQGLRVVTPGPDSESTDLRAFSWNPGTTVAVSIRRPQGDIVGIDRDASNISDFRDDHGTDLWAGPKAGKFSNSRLDMVPRVSEDRTAILFEVDAQGIPRRGSTTLSLQGSVQLLLAEGKTSFTAKDVSLEEGSRFTIGSRTVEVTAVGSPSWGDGYAATLKLKGDVEDIVDIAFLDTSGNELPANRQSTLWSGSGEARVNRWEYVFESRPAGPVQVVATQWTDLTTQPVPLDLTFGAGL